MHQIYFHCYQKISAKKSGYTATPVACGWVGAIFEVTIAFGQEQWGQRPQKNKKIKFDGRTDGPTDRRTDGPMDGRT